jgi:hypothetical protein
MPGLQQLLAVSQNRRQRAFLMTDDIVSRLREYNPIRGFIDWHDTMTTAADEIELLRKERDEWRKQAMFWYDQASKLALEGADND